MGRLVEILLGPALRPVPARRALRTAGHDGHRVLGARVRATPAGRALPVPAGQYAPAARGSLRQSRVTPSSRVSVGSRRAWSRRPTDYVAFCQMLANGGSTRRAPRHRPQDVIELMRQWNHLLLDGATLARFLAVGGFWRGQLRGCWLPRPRIRRRPRDPWPRPWRQLGRRVRLGRGGEHRLLDRPGRGPVLCLHDPALPVGGLPVPQPATGARLPSTRQLMNKDAGPVGPSGGAGTPRPGGRQPRAPIRRSSATFARLPTAAQVAQLGRRASWASPSTAGPATVPAPASALPPCARPRACSVRTTPPPTRCPSLWPRWSTPATSPAPPSAPRKRWTRRFRPERTSLLANGGRLVSRRGRPHDPPLPLLRATAKRHGPVALVHFDAHLDTWDTYFGQRFTHGTPFRRAWEEGLLLRDHSIHVGLRAAALLGQGDLTEERGHGLRRR